MPESDFTLRTEHFFDKVAAWRESYAAAEPFPHIAIDDFLPRAHALFLLKNFPQPDHPVWLDWKKRSGHQYGKQGPGDSARFDLLDTQFWLALNEFNSWKFLQVLERITGIERLIGDPYFQGGGMHQILPGGFLDIHTDFNRYDRLGLFRRLNVLIYLNPDWQPAHNGCLELWDAGPPGGQCVKSIAPAFNRAVIFHTTKHSFHGHPAPWQAPEGQNRKSIALYYYTAQPAADEQYDNITDFQGVAYRDLT